jgi:rod shape-determining protein MreC
VILLTDLNSRIPVIISTSSGSTGNIQAIMAGDNSPMPMLDMVSHTVTLHPGDQVTSSGDGGLLPAGLPVGTVVADGSGSWRVALLADAAASQDVEILNFSKPPEALPAQPQLPAEAAGLKPVAPPPPPAAAATVAPAAPLPAKPKPVPQTPPAATTPPPATQPAAPEEDVDR